MSWGEAADLFFCLLQDPSSQSYRCMANWEFSLSRESLLLMDLADIVATALGSKQEHIHERPWTKVRVKVRRLSNTARKALLARMNAGTLSAKDEKETINGNR